MEETSQPPATGMMTYLLIMMLLLILVSSPGIREVLGSAIGVVFNPLIGFDGRYPFLTLVLGIMILSAISGIVRYFTTDWELQGRVQHVQFHLSKYMTEARKTGDRELMMEVMRIQQKLLPLQAEMQKKSMKPTFITLFIFVGAITWFYDFFESVPDTRIYFPGFGIVDLLHRGFYFPNWLWLYMFFSFAFASLLTAIMKLLLLERKWRS